MNIILKERKNEKKERKRERKKERKKEKRIQKRKKRKGDGKGVSEIWIKKKKFYNYFIIFYLYFFYSFLFYIFMFTKKETKNGRDQWLYLKDKKARRSERSFKKNKKDLKKY